MQKDMAIVFEFVWEIFFEFILSAPGAAVLWLKRGGKEAYQLILSNDQNKCASIGLALWIIAIASISVLVRLNS